MKLPADATLAIPNNRIAKPSFLANVEACESTQDRINLTDY
jgi:hypothetical protein